MGRPPKTPNDELDKFLLRMPDGLRDRIKVVADENNRSMNAEIVATLEEKYPARFRLDDFFEIWIEPMRDASRQKQEKLIAAADSFLKANVRSDLSVWLENFADDVPYHIGLGTEPGPLIRSMPEERRARYEERYSKAPEEPNGKV